jgi:Flp pilus assembly protein TadG
LCPRPRRGSGQSVVEFALVLPLLLFVLLAVADFARIYTAMLTVESAAREAADYGTFGAERWRQDTYATVTEPEMERRACLAASNLTGYVGSGASCTNPDFDYCITPGSTPGLACTRPPAEADHCEDPNRPDPCRVTVRMTYDFDILVPLRIEMLGVELGLPSTITFTRDSTFAMTDIQLATPAP